MYVYLKLFHNKKIYIIKINDYCFISGRLAVPHLQQV